MVIKVYMAYYEWNTQRPGCGVELATHRIGIFSSPEVANKAIELDTEAAKESGVKQDEFSRYFITEVPLNIYTGFYNTNKFDYENEEDTEDNE